MTIAEKIYNEIITLIFGVIEGNEWYTAHLDAVRGILTVVLTCLVILIAFAIVVATIRFIGRCCDFTGGRRRR